MSTSSFTRSIFNVTGKDMNVFIDQWVRTGGHAHFQMQFVFNRKRFKLFRLYYSARWQSPYRALAVSTFFPQRED